MSEQVEQDFLEFERARTLVGLGRFDEAAGLLHQLLGRDPENGLGWCLLAQTQLGRQDAQAALEAVEHAVAVAPELNWAHRLRSVTLAVLGDHEGAIAAALEAIKLAPNEWQGYACLARVLTRVKARRAEAVSAAEYAVALAPHESDAHLAHGIAAAANGKRKEAEAAFGRALAIDPQNSDAHNELARLKLRKSRFGAAKLADAAGGFQTAIQADPHASVSRRNLELTLRVFLSRLSYLIFIGSYFYWRMPASSSSGSTDLSLLILAFLCIPTVYGWRFVSRLSPDLRQHLRYTITHGRLGIAAAIQGFAIALLLFSLIASPANHAGTAAAAAGLTFLARIIVVRDKERIAGVNGGKLFTKTSLQLIAVALALITLLFAVGASQSGFGAGGVLLALISGALFLGMIYAIRKSRRA